MALIIRREERGWPATTVTTPNPYLFTDLAHAQAVLRQMAAAEAWDGRAAGYHVSCTPSAQGSEWRVAVNYPSGEPRTLITLTLATARAAEERAWAWGRRTQWERPL